MKNFKKERAEARKKAKELVSKMTLMEKAAQLKYDASPVERLGVPTYNYQMCRLRKMYRRLSKRCGIACFR